MAPQCMRELAACPQLLHDVEIRLPHIHTVDTTGTQTRMPQSIAQYAIHYTIRPLNAYEIHKICQKNKWQWNLLQFLVIVQSTSSCEELRRWGNQERTQIQNHIYTEIRYESDEVKNDYTSLYFSHVCLFIVQRYISSYYELECEQEHCLPFSAQTESCKSSVDYYCVQHWSGWQCIVLSVHEVAPYKCVYNSQLKTNSNSYNYVKQIITNYGF